MKRFDRDSILALPLSSRVNKLEIGKVAAEAAGTSSISPEAEADAKAAAAEARAARARGAPVILAFGAHSIKNGLGPAMIRLLKGGFVTHFATNGAGVIHDWEFAFQGRSGEDVRRYVSEGQFGIWNETGTWLNLAIAVGAYRGLGYGEAVGSMIAEEGLGLPSRSELADAIRRSADGSEALGAGAPLSAAPSPAAPPAGRTDPIPAELRLERGAAAADLMALGLALERLGSTLPFGPGGTVRIQHPWKASSLAAAAREAGIPFTCHPMFGHDIIYTHPANRGAAIGRAAERDFLSFVDSVASIEGGVYLSLGSAVMSPMIFEKALSMARNVARREGRSIADFSLHVVDLARSSWDWNRDGEPPQDDPAYYLRFNKTFSRMGGRMSYASADNRAWLGAFMRELGAS